MFHIKELGISDGEFVRATLTETDSNLLCSELFGHVKGAFTGADKERTGVIESSKNGTVLLDEIGDISKNVQRKLLSVFNDFKFVKVGQAEKAMDTNAMFVLATNRNLEELVQKGKFERALYDRIRVLQFRVPSLNERRDDIVRLAMSFIHRWNKAKNCSLYLGSSAKEALEGMNFREGGVRHLEKMIIEDVLPKARDEGAQQISLSHFPMGRLTVKQEGGEKVEFIYPQEFGKTKAKFDTVKKYVKVCRGLVESNPEKLDWELKDVDNHLGTSGRFKGYINERPEAFFLFVKHNYEQCRAAIPILRKNTVVERKLTHEGLIY
ncbi:MAG: sigma 54-interacting transcriptional regulator [Candidatus Thermoplasmatota archaeon]|nr:sigma 54-interacting transcriptional regulator [Candidatus Thermoplasmatota archaeon]